MENTKHFICFGTALLLLNACNTDSSIDTLESNPIGEKNFVITSTQMPFSVENQKLLTVQGNKLRLYGLGEISQTHFGSTKAQIVSQVQLSSYNPVFGKLSAHDEEKNNTPENETVERAYLYLPFYSTNTQGNTFVLDSIYGNQESPFDLHVSLLNQQLRDINENYASQVYFSSDSFEKGETLGKAIGAKINNTPLTRYEFDNPQTPENEAQNVRDILPPALQIELDKNFFQKQILDKEGKYELSTFMLFQQHIKGIVLQMENLSNPLFMYLNLPKAKIVIEYAYTHQQSKQKALLELSLITEKEEKKDGNTYVTQQGIAINTFDNQSVGSSEEQIYLQGQQGYIAQITLDENTIKQLQAQALLINQATLTLYVNETLSDVKQLPSYLTLFNAKTGVVITDFTDTSSVAYATIGKLSKNEKGYFYSIKLTDHLSRIIQQKTENVQLGLAVSTTNIKENITIAKGKTSQGEINLPLGSIQTPKAVVLHAGDGSPKSATFEVQYIKGK